MEVGGQSDKASKHNMSPRSPLSPQSPYCDSIDLAMEDTMVDNNIDHLYTNIYEMASSNDMSPSFRSCTTYGNESRIDAELRHLAGGESEEDTGVGVDDDHTHKPESVKDSIFISKSVKSYKKNGLAARAMPLPRSDKNLGPYLLKKARDVISHGGNTKKAIRLAERAKASFEKSFGQGKKLNLDYVMCLHILASMHCSTEEFEAAILLLEKSINIIPEIATEQSHCLAKFAGFMQLGDVYAGMGKVDKSISLYRSGLEIQRDALGERDARFGETCRYVAQAYVQALQFNEAERLCKIALDTHKESGAAVSLEETADRRLLGLICDSKGNHEAALEHYSLASMAMSSNNAQESDSAAIDCNIGDAYLALARYDEALICYQKALTVFSSSNVENHPSVASVLVRLAELHYKVGKFGESKTYCDNALRMYRKPCPGSSLEEIASGLVELSVIYESMNELEMCRELLEKAVKIYSEKVQGMSQQSLISGIEAQLGVIHYMLGDYKESYNSLKSAIPKLEGCGEKSSLQGFALNQLGLTCVQLCAITDAALSFEEARRILQKEYGLCHPATLGVCSNLAATYDVLGRRDDAIEILEFVVETREEKLGTADPVVDDEKRRLGEMLKELGRGRSKKTRSLEFLLDDSSEIRATG